MPTQISLANLSFPELQLHPSAGHKLRGYFIDQFKNYSNLLHNHSEGDKVNYRYPLIQYKVVKKIPTLIGIGAGAKVLIELLQPVRHIRLEDLTLPVHYKQFKSEIVQVGVDPDQLFCYRFQTLWMALSQKNYRLYQSHNDPQSFLEGILQPNILSFCSGIGYFEQERITLKFFLEGTKKTKFKNQPMLAFHGHFVSNMELPNFIGLGKSVSRGFGTITKSS